MTYFSLIILLILQAQLGAAAVLFENKIKPDTSNILSDAARYDSLANRSIQQSEINSFIKKTVAAKKNNDQKFKREVWIIIILSACTTTVIISYLYKYTCLLRQKRQLLTSEIDELKVQVDLKCYDEIVALAKKNDSAFLMKFQEAYPAFIIALQQINPNLESSELTFCALIRLNFTTKEIAAYTFVQPTSVIQRKRRLKKRLNMLPETDLYRFINTINL